MTINYPNGKPFQKNHSDSVFNQNKKATQYGNRGMNLEEYISQSNQYYLERGIGVIHKKPTPIQVVKVDYPKRSAAVIREAYYRQSSTTDFNGIYKGLYIDFEAKETKNKTSFPLNNIHDHQIKHMQQCQDMGGITFVLIGFTSLDRVFLLDSAHFIDFENKYKRKSIPIAYIEEHGFEVSYGFQPTLNYLSALDKLLEEKQFRGERNNVERN